MVAALIIGGILLLLICIILIRTLIFVPKETHRSEAQSVSLDTDNAINTLAEMIRCRTVSHADRTLDDEGEFDKFKMILPKLFPNVFSKCTYEEPGERSILIRWRGQTDGDPTVFMAHYDVVSVSSDGWDKPAFDGIIENGVLFGRGTLDTKGTLNGILFAAEELIKTNFVPQNDIYFAFGGDEEVNGCGAKNIVELFKKRGISPALVLDEGGAVVNNVFPGVKRSSALIGIAEKGMVNIEYSSKSDGGHSSAPPKKTPVDRLSMACLKVVKKDFKFRLTEPATKMFDTMARYSAFGYRLIFANLWLFAPVLNLITKKNGGELNAIVRTTTSFTQMEGSQGMNVIPPYARMVSNHRIIPGEDVNGVLERIRKAVNDNDVSVRVISGMDPSRISDMNCDAWNKISEAVWDTWQDVIVSPYLMLACSDSRNYGEISDKVYRFSAMALTKEERALIHGNNERISLDQIKKCIEFYVRLMRKC